MKKESSYYLGIDIGGTWTKVCVFPNSEDSISKTITPFDVEKYFTKVKSNLNQETRVMDFITVLKLGIGNLGLNDNQIVGIGISTAGLVNFEGSKILKAAPHLNVLKNEEWINELERIFKCNVSLINDADAAAIGLAELGYLQGLKTIGVLPIGTGLGCCIWRNGRRWRPGKLAPLLGCVNTPYGTFDNFASASLLAKKDENNDLLKVLTASSFKDERENYIVALSKLINSAILLYNLTEIIICGGLADAANTCGFNLEGKLNKGLQDLPGDLGKDAIIKVAKEGNRLQLIGALALAKGCSYIAMIKKPKRKANPINKISEKNDNNQDMFEMFWQAEQKTNLALKECIPKISHISENISERIKKGGRIIYIGTGSSGRIATVNNESTLEMYGLPKDKVITIISGGVSNATVQIETGYERVASAVPETLLLNIRPEDVVIGIAAKKTSYYVKSGLAFAKSRGALSILIKASSIKKASNYSNEAIDLNVGKYDFGYFNRNISETTIKRVISYIASFVKSSMVKEC